MEWQLTMRRCACGLFDIEALVDLLFFLSYIFMKAAAPYEEKMKMKQEKKK